MVPRSLVYWSLPAPALLLSLCQGVNFSTTIYFLMSKGGTYCILLQDQRGTICMMPNIIKKKKGNNFKMSEGLKWRSWAAETTHLSLNSALNSLGTIKCTDRKEALYRGQYVLWTSHPLKQEAPYFLLLSPHTAAQNTAGCHSSGFSFPYALQRGQVLPR